MDDKRIAAIDFLLYSYFGIKSDCEKEEMIDACIKRAYLDVCRTISFPDREDFSQNDSKGLYFLTIVSGIIHDQIKLDLLENDYQVWHKKTCRQIIDVGQSEEIKIFYGESIHLTYGHAQKWVNMTMKYLYLLEMLLEKGYVSCNWGELHVPIDSYIIEAFDKQTKSKTKDILGTSTWSNIGDVVKYEHYQKELAKVAGSKSPIDWEGPAWIDVAKARSKKDREKKDKRLDELKKIPLK